VCSSAVPYLTTLVACGARVERAIVGAGAGDASTPRADDPAAEFAAHVALADLALQAHARSHGVDRRAHRDQVTLVAQAEVQLLAERVEEGHERGFVTGPVTMLAESLARALRCAEHDREAFREAAVDWGASALALYALATL
jgi:hypothetical protein